MTVEEALKEGKITMDLLDKYEVEYIKKEKEQYIILFFKITSYKADSIGLQQICHSKNKKERNTKNMIKYKNSLL